MRLVTKDGKQLTFYATRDNEVKGDKDSQLRTAMLNAGIEVLPDVFNWDGKLHRFRSSDKKKKNGFYVAHDGLVPCATFGCWYLGVESFWKADMTGTLTPKQITEAEIQIQQRKKERAAQRAEERIKLLAALPQVWQDATLPSSDNAYLQAKKVGAHYIKENKRGLVVPMLDHTLQIVGFQYITNTFKSQHTGSTAKNSFYVLGQQASDLVYVAEGYSTAASIYEATGQPTVITFGSGNIQGAIASYKTAYKYAGRIVIVADNDSLNEKEKDIGERKAKKAALYHGCEYTVIPEPGDANDYANAGGDLKALLAGVKEPPKTLVHIDDFIAEPKPIRWLIKDYLPRDSLCMIHGASGNGKTFVVLDMALHVAAGYDSWHGQRTKPASVLYLAGEGHNGLRARITAWLQAQQERPKCDMWLSTKGCDLNTPEGLAGVMGEIEAAGAVPELIIVDTLHRFLAGDENSAKDARTMIEACAELQRAYGCTVVLVHHTGAAAEVQNRARGSTAWKGALEVELSVGREQDGTIKLAQFKNKDGEQREALHFDLQQVTLDGWLDEDGEAVTSAVLEPLVGYVAKNTQDMKKERTASKHLHTFIGAWKAGNRDLIDGKPALHYKDFLRYLVEQEIYKSEASAKNALKPSKETSLVTRLTESGDVERIQLESGSVWVLVNQTSIDVLKLTGCL